VTGVRFRTREIGSLAKPAWRVKALAGRPLDEADVADAERWGRRLELGDHDRLLALLRREHLDAAARAAVVDWSARYGIALLERAGLDVVYDGEQRRSEMYDHAVRQASGFAARGSVRAFDDKYFTKGAVVAPPQLEATDVDEYRFVRAQTAGVVKVPLTGPYTIVDWSYDEHYDAGRRLGAPAAARTGARRRFALDAAGSLVGPNAAALAAAGADWIQIDEPAAAAKPHETPLMVEAVNLALRGLDVRRSVHVCFSDYRSLWPAVLELEHCHELQPEFANRDSHSPGTRAEDRPGYAAVLPFFRTEGSPRVGLGVVDVHTDFVEPAELVRDRILYATRVLEPERIEINPDCGLRTRTWDVAYEKLARMVEGARLAEAAL
jgi:5-methyltetrahydropteroyltriglutamate--homocysteine methyltransferase